MDEGFLSAYVFVALVDARLSGKQHLRDCWGEAIFTLDELMVAIEDGRWPGPDVLPAPRQARDATPEVRYAEAA